jgi:hypothetical protein
MYPTDNASALVPSYPAEPEVWVQGDMSKASEAGNTDLIRQGRLYHYTQSVSIFTAPPTRIIPLARSKSPPSAATP